MNQSAQCILDTEIMLILVLISAAAFGNLAETDWLN